MLYLGHCSFPFPRSPTLTPSPITLWSWLGFAMSRFALSPPSLCLQAHAASRKERHWSVREACCVSSPDTWKLGRSGLRVLMIVCSAWCARFDVLIRHPSLAQPPRESCRSTLQAGAGRHQLVCALVVLPVLLVKDSPAHRRSVPSASLELRVLPRQNASHPSG